MSNRLEELRKKQVVSYDEFTRLSAHAKATSFASTGIEDVRIMQKMKGLIEDYLTQAKDEFDALKIGSKADFIYQTREILRDHGMIINTDDDSIDNVGGFTRLGLIFDVNVRQAYGRGRYMAGMSPIALKLKPAWRFVRLPGVKVKRPLHEDNEDIVRLKIDTPFWTFMNNSTIGGFEVPYPPFGFNSYMDFEEVRRDEAIRLGLMTDVKNEEPRQQVNQPTTDDATERSQPDQGNTQVNPGPSGKTKPTASQLMSMFLSGSLTAVSQIMREDAIPEEITLGASKITPEFQEEFIRQMEAKGVSGYFKDGRFVVNAKPPSYSIEASKCNAKVNSCKHSPNKGTTREGESGKRLHGYKVNRNDPYHVQEKGIIDALDYVIKNGKTLPSVYNHPQIGKIDFPVGNLGNKSDKYKGGYGVGHALRLEHNIKPKDIALVIIKGKKTHLSPNDPDFLGGKVVLKHDGIVAIFAKNKKRTGVSNQRGDVRLISVTRSKKYDR